MPKVSEVDEPKPARRSTPDSGIVSILLAVALIVALTAASAWYFTRGGDAEASSKGIIVMPAGKGCDKDVVASKAMLAQGFTPSEIVVGEDQVDWSSAEANERGSAAFASATPTNAAALVEELRSDTDQANAALAALMDESGATREQLLTSTNWIPVQFKVASSWDGNTAYSGGQAVPAGTRQSDAGDVVWLFIQPEKCQEATSGTIPATEAVTAHRAGCGNPQLALPRPSQPTTPPRPTTPTAPPTTPSGEQGKDHRLAPWSPEAVHCPQGQVMDRNSEQCVAWPTATTHTTPTTDGRNDSGDGAVNTVPPPNTVAPPVTVPNTTPPTGPPPTPPTIPF